MDDPKCPHQVQKNRPDFPFGVQPYMDFIKFKVSGSLMTGGIYGCSLGYFLGDMTSLYGLTHGFGFGFLCWTFYSTAYALQVARQENDLYNYAVSGALNGGCIASAIQNVKRVPIAIAGGAAVGVLLHYSTNLAYSGAQKTWIAYRRNQIMYSRPRTLLIRKPQFPPKENRITLNQPKNNIDVGKLAKLGIIFAFLSKILAIMTISDFYAKSLRIEVKILTEISRDYPTVIGQNETFLQ
eukprot:gene6487-13092_t